MHALLISDFIMLKKVLSLLEIDVSQLSMDPFDVEHNMMLLVAEFINVHRSSNNNLGEMIPKYYKILTESSLNTEVMSLNFLLKKDLGDLIIKLLKD